MDADDFVAEVVLRAPASAVVLDKRSTGAGWSLETTAGGALALEVRDGQRLVAIASEPLIARNSNLFILDCPDGIGRIRGDQTRLRQVLFNLISNAAKFTQAGRITLRIARTHAPRPGFVFDLSDTGIGMSAEQLERVFQSFTQAEPSIHIKYGGTGLGLALSKKLTQLMGGEITVVSEPGKGSTFSVFLPSPPSAP